MLHTKIIKFENSSIIYDLEALLRRSFCHQNDSSFLFLQSSQVQIIIKGLWSWLTSFQVKPFAINFIALVIFQNLCIVRTNVEEHGIGILSIEISNSVSQYGRLNIYRNISISIKIIKRFKREPSQRIIKRFLKHLIDNAV